MTGAKFDHTLRSYGRLERRYYEAQREIARLRQGLWDCATEAGVDTDGNTTPRHLAHPDIVDFAVEAVRELRKDYEA